MGQVAGSDGAPAGFVWQDGVFEIASPRNGFGSQFLAVNKKGHAAGKLGTQATYWDGQHLQTIASRHGLAMESGNAINERDEIVGSGSSSIVKYSDGALVDIVPGIDNAQGWRFDSWGRSTGINERGEITGRAGHDEGGGQYSVHGYILVPQD